MPRMKTAPAGMPMTTGHGRLVVEDEGCTGGPGGFGSAGKNQEEGRKGQEHLCETPGAGAWWGGRHGAPGRTVRKALRKL